MKHPFKMNHILKNHYIKEEQNTLKLQILYKFKINATGSLSINEKSTITITNSSTTPEIAIALLELRCINTKNKNVVKLLNKIIEEVKLTDEEIDEILMENNENNKVFHRKNNKNN